MYVLPEKGISPSRTVHNCDKIAIADWILASALLVKRMFLGLMCLMLLWRVRPIQIRSFARNSLLMCGGC